MKTRKKKAAPQYKHYREFLSARGVPDVAVVQREPMGPAPRPSSKLSKDGETNIN